MNFKLIINGSGVRKLDENILLEAIDQLAKRKENEDYLILEPKTAIENNIYLQVMYDTLEGFVVDTRFIFSSADDFKHYNCTYRDVEEVKALFLDYYNCILPPIALWSNESNAEELDTPMTKLYKRKDNMLYYVEFWADENQLTIHKGEVGDIGQTQTQDIQPNDLPLAVQIEKLIYDHQKQGYTAIEDLVEIIIQYPYNVGDDRAVLETMQGELEDLMNECLGWTGNGHCDGWDIDEGKRNTFCYVIDKEIALLTICEVLEDNNLLKGVVIAYADEEQDEFVAMYPQGAKFEL